MWPTAPPPDPADQVDNTPPDVAGGDELGDVDETADVPDVAVGDIVTVTYADTANPGVDVVRHGLVVDVADGAAVVGYLTEVSAPIPLDHTVHGDRVDAPRVARIGA